MIGQYTTILFSSIILISSFLLKSSGLSKSQLIVLRSLIKVFLASKSCMLSLLFIFKGCIFSALLLSVGSYLVGLLLTLAFFLFIRPILPAINVSAVFTQLISSGVLFFFNHSYISYFL